MYLEPLVVKAHGGKSGGGTQLTARGKALILEFRALEKELTAFLETQSGKIR
jgi:molybdate transport system regulatory protein